MGSRSDTDLAYIAGFLDGDGSLMLQLKKRNDSKRKYRFMCTICLYQDSRHEENLSWMRRLLGIGYLTRRNDGISELRINGYKQVREILLKLLPYIRFKKDQAEALYRAADLLASRNRDKLSEFDLRFLVDKIVCIQNNNYVARKKRTLEELLAVLGLTP